MSFIDGAGRRYTRSGPVQLCKSPFSKLIQSPTRRANPEIGLAIFENRECGVVRQSVIGRKALKSILFLRKELANTTPGSANPESTIFLKNGKNRGVRETIASQLAGREAEKPEPFRSNPQIS